MNKKKNLYASLTHLVGFFSITKIWKLLDLIFINKSKKLEENSAEKRCKNKTKFNQFFIICIKAS